ncbi:MAG: STAS domain-containing protein [Chloroflexota bacterium]|nr:STAS domain-containing protein [Chloroflexota bacterium]MDE2894772.1 STAS domain-containing protein [Chloroflexota bacterium]
MVDLYPEYDDSVLVLNPLGRIDGTNAKAFEEALLGRIDAGDTQILMNFEGINYISSAGLRVLLMAAKRTSQSAGQLALCGVQDHIQEVFKFSGFSEIIPIHDDRPAALNTF